MQAAGRSTSTCGPGFASGSGGRVCKLELPHPGGGRIATDRHRRHGPKEGPYHEQAIWRASGVNLLPLWPRKSPQRQVKSPQRQVSAEYSVRMSIGHGCPARGQARKLRRDMLDWVSLKLWFKFRVYWWVVVELEATHYPKNTPPWLPFQVTLASVRVRFESLMFFLSERQNGKNVFDAASSKFLGCNQSESNWFDAFNLSSKPVPK